MQRTLPDRLAVLRKPLAKNRYGILSFTICALIVLASVFTLQPRLGEASNPGPSPSGEGGHLQQMSCLDDPDGFDSEPELAGSDSDGEQCPFHEPDDGQPSSDSQPYDPIREPFDDAKTWNPAPADWKLDSHQLGEWNAVEQALDLKTEWKNCISNSPKKRRKEAPEPEATAPLNICGNFFSASSFQGARSDCVFKLGPYGVGYYREAASPNRTTTASQISLDRCIEAPSTEANAPFLVPSTTRSARQQKLTNGKRRRPKRRCDREKPDTRSLGCQDLGDCKIGDDDWKRKGYYAIDSLNGNCWATTKGLLNRSSADVACIQETKLSGADAQATIASQAQAVKWQSHASLAHGCSGGCAVATKSGIGITPHPDKLVGDGYQHRFKLAHVSACLRGGFHCGSVYPKDSEGISEDNLLLLLEIAIALRQVQGPWILGGDWNMNPATLAKTRWLELVGGRIFAPSSPTCHTNVYDYFVVSNCFSQAVVGIARIADAGIFPHWPSRLVLRGNARRTLVRKQVKPPKISGVLPQGPTQQHECMDKLGRDSVEHSEVHSSNVHQKLEADLKSWFLGARSEWASLVGDKPMTDCPLVATFKFAPAVGPPARAEAGMSNFSICWRIAARNITEVTKILEGSWCKNVKGNPVEKAALVASKHLRALEETAFKAPAGFFKNSFAAWTLAIRHALFGNDIPALIKMCSIADAKAKSLELLTRKECSNKWRNALSDCRVPGCKLPSRLAYRWIKGPSGFAISPICEVEAAQKLNDEFEIPVEKYPSSVALKSHEVGAGCTNVPLDGQVEVEFEASKWAVLWECDKSYVTPQVTGLGPPPPALAGIHIRRAAVTFPAHTGLGGDNASPRAYDRLSDAALEALARLLLLCEIIGSWPMFIRLIYIVLLPKPDGGRRPIGLFISIMRIWMRARSSVARQWEAMNARPCLYGGTGMGAQRAAWNVAFRAEHAALSDRDYAQSLLDLVKAFEKVPHWALIASARKHKYCLFTFRLSLDAYKCARTIVINGVCSRLLIALCGITAGSGFATTELRILVLDVIDSTYVLYKGIDLAVFVDDFTIEASGKCAVVLVAKATDHVITFFEKGLNMEISSTKSVVLGAKPSISNKVVARMHSGKVSAVKQAKLLGTPSGGGRRRSTKASKQRIVKVKATIPRLHALRRLRVRTTLMARAAATPALTYGCEICGFSDSHLDQTRSVVARAGSPEGSGKDPNLILMILDGPKGTLDSAFDAHCLPIMRWAQAWYENWQSPRVLTQAFADAKLKVARAKRSVWDVAAGPVAGLLGTMARIKWEHNGPSILSDDVGRVFNCKIDPPVVIANAVKDSVRRWRLAKAAAKFPALVPEKPDYIDPRMTEELFRNDGLLPHGTIALATSVTKLLDRRGHKSLQFPEWQAKHKASLVSAFTGGQWTQCRLSAHSKFTDDSRCQLCLGETGNTAHRRQCPSTMPTGGWSRPTSSAGKFIAKLEPKRHKIALDHGLCVTRIIVAPPP